MGFFAPVLAAFFFPFGLDDAFGLVVGAFVFVVGAFVLVAGVFGLAVEVACAFRLLLNLSKAAGSPNPQPPRL